MSVRVVTTEYELHDDKGLEIGTIELNNDDKLRFVPGTVKTGQGMSMFGPAETHGPMTYSLKNLKNIVAAWEELLKRESKVSQVEVTND